MRKNQIISKIALAACLLAATFQTSRAQIPVTITESSTPPTPGTYDAAQLQSAAFGTGLKPGGLNYYWDANVPTGGANGSTFFTGSNPSGYVLNSVTINTLGGGGSDGIGGITTPQPYWVRIYAVSGSNSASLQGFYQSQVYAFQTEGDWLQVSGLNLALKPNQEYAYTFSRSWASYENLGSTNGIPATTSQIVEIPAAGGTINFGSAANWATGFASGTFDIGLSLPTRLTVAPPVASPLANSVSPVVQGTSVTLTAGTIVDPAGNGSYTYQWLTDGGSGGALTNIPGATASALVVNTANVPLGQINYQLQVTDSTLAGATSTAVPVFVKAYVSAVFTDLGTTTPAAGSYDISQLINDGNGNKNSGNLNYYTDDGQKGGSSPYDGQTFTTGNNPKGYQFNSLAIDLNGGSSSSTTTKQGYDVFLYSISADGTTATLLADITNLQVAYTYGDWIKFDISATPLTLNSNTVYAWSIGRKSSGTGWGGISTDPGSSDLLPGGQLVGIYGNGTTYGTLAPLEYSTAGSSDATFDLALIPIGVNLVVGVPSASANPVYALSPVTLTDHVLLPTNGTFTYKWLTDDGSGAVPPNYITIPGATSTNLTFTPLDLNPSGYTTNFYFVASVGGSSATSAPVVLTVNAAAAPVFTATPTVTNLVTFAGPGSVTWSAAEAGTLPLTNQWQFSNGGAFANLPLQTNTTLTLNGLLTSESGTYQLAASNLLGSTNLPVSLTVLPTPAAPGAGEAYAKLVDTNQLWAYWRLNETNDPTAPGAPIYSAYDYSGHGFNALYGNAITVSNAGPQSPTFPGFATTELAAQTAGSAGGTLTVPNLNLTGKTNLTFMAWIYPNGPVGGAVGLLFNRGGPDSACGFGFGNNTDQLGYTWNNNSQSTWSWNSGVAVAENQWNFVAYVITPTNTTVYLGNLNNNTTNFQSAANALANTGETWAGGTIELGGDANSVGRGFNGYICEASLLTNSLSSAQIQQYFLTSVGAAALAPTVTTSQSASSVYLGQNVVLNGAVAGTAPLTNQWQYSVDEINWYNIPGATTASVVLPQTTLGTIYYQLVVKNQVGAVTNGPLQVTVNALPLPLTPGVWTVNFVFTNNLAAGTVINGGIGYYSGPGIIGSGTYWNQIPDVAPGGVGSSLRTGINLSSVSDFKDDGATHSGIYANVYNASGFTSPGTVVFNGDIAQLLNQYVNIYYSPGALQFVGVPDGTYNLVLFGADGTYGDRGTTFVVYDPLNGDQTNSTLNSTANNVVPNQQLNEGDNFVLFSNVHASGGTLTVDIDPNPNAHGGGNTEADFNGAQIQLVSYDVPAPSVTLSSTYAPATSTNAASLRVTWPQGILQTATNLLGPWTPVYAPSPITASTTNTAQYFRVEVHP